MKKLSTIIAVLAISTSAVFAGDNENNGNNGSSFLASSSTLGRTYSLFSGSIFVGNVGTAKISFRLNKPPIAVGAFVGGGAISFQQVHFTDFSQAFTWSSY